MHAQRGHCSQLANCRSCMAGDPFTVWMKSYAFLTLNKNTQRGAIQPHAATKPDGTGITAAFTAILGCLQLLSRQQLAESRGGHVGPEGQARDAPTQQQEQILKLLFAPNFLVASSTEAAVRDAIV